MRNCIYDLFFLPVWSPLRLPYSHGQRCDRSINHFDEIALLIQLPLDPRDRAKPSTLTRTDPPTLVLVDPQRAQQAKLQRLSMAAMNGLEGYVLLSSGSVQDADSAAPRARFDQIVVRGSDCEGHATVVLATQGPVFSARTLAEDLLPYTRDGCVASE